MSSTCFLFNKPSMVFKLYPPWTPNLRMVFTIFAQFEDGLLLKTTVKTQGWDFETFFCGVVWCGVVWCGVVWCGVVWCGVVWCGVVWCGVWCGVVWCGVVWLVWCGVCVCVCVMCVDVACSQGFLTTSHQQWSCGVNRSQIDLSRLHVDNFVARLVSLDNGPCHALHTRVNHHERPLLC